MADRRSLLGDGFGDNQNIFDDEFEVDDFDVVADGFRPSPAGQNDDGLEDETRRLHREHTPPITSASAHYADHPLSPSRNSIRKDRRAAENPFSSPEDTPDAAEDDAILSYEPGPEDMAQRTISSASSYRYARTSSPRFSSGPSHPYAMYPQGTVARSLSIATTSTVRPLQRQSSSAAPAPQHPYAMYPQGVDEDLEDDMDAIAPNPVPMGFLTLGQSYERRVGPDGEDQEIVGALGHIEQLPPYTRFPEDGPEKMPLLVPEAPVALHSRAPVAGTDPTMPLMHTPLAPPPAPSQQQSMTDPSALARSTSRATRSSFASSEKFILEKQWKDMTWSQRLKKRFCGIPFWIYLLLLLILVFVGSVLGGVIGGFVVGTKKHRTPPFPGPSTSLYDASAIPTPTSMIPPTGTWALQLSTPTEVADACLVNPNQGVAWSCDLGGKPAAALAVGSPPGSNKTGAFLYYASSDDQIYYGAQASYLQTTFAPFLAVIDNDAPENGPAYYFQQFYDKLVVLPESALSPSSGTAKVKRDFFLDEAWFEKKQLALPGQRPWFCVWNQTFVEGFIYVQQTIASSYALSIPTNNPTALGPTTISSSSGAQATAAAASTTQNNAIVTSTVALPSTTATFIGPSSNYASWSSALTFDQKGYQGSGARPFDDDGARGHKRDSAWADLPMFPYVLKIEERRLPGNPYQPYCQQYQILDNGQWNYVEDAAGNAIIVELDEQDPNYATSQAKSGLANNRRIKRHDLPADSCHCQWMSGQ